MNVRLLAAALIICAATATQAQSGAKPQASTAVTADTQADAQAKAKAQASLLTTELGLDPKQAMQVEQLLTKAEEKAVALRADGEKGKPSLEKLSAGTFASVKEILTPEQAKKLDALKAAGKWDVACASVGSGCGGHGAANGKPACCQGKGAHAEKAPATVQ